MSKWTYALVFDDSVGSRDEVTKFLDGCPEILYWYTCLSHAVFIVSERSATDLTGLFRKFTKDRGRFFIIDAESDRNGWLPSKAWELMKRPDAVASKNGD